MISRQPGYRFAWVLAGRDGFAWAALDGALDFSAVCSFVTGALAGVFAFARALAWAFAAASRRRCAFFSSSATPGQTGNFPAFFRLSPLKTRT